MKKALLLSVVASTMIMAGGDIEPMEPMVEEPAAAPVVSGWTFGGKGVVYYQTNDTAAISGATTGDLFEQDASGADAGLQLRATNDDVIGGIGAGIEVNGLATLNLQSWMVSNVMQSIHGNLHGGWISQAYLTFGAGNTSVKVGRQELPKALSPFAFSENWNVFSNTFDAAVLVNSDLPDTTLVAAYVSQRNYQEMHGDMATFGNINNAANDGAYMVTLQNKSISDLTLTGSVYYLPEHFGAGSDDLFVYWGDAAFNAGSFGIAGQGGTVTSDQTGFDDLTAYGVKAHVSMAGITLAAAYSSVESDSIPMLQLGGNTSALYTVTALDQVDSAIGAAPMNQDKILVSANAALAGGNFTVAYADATNSDSANIMIPEYSEIDAVFSTNLSDSVNLTAAYVYADVDTLPDAINLVRVVASYNF